MRGGGESVMMNGHQPTHKWSASNWDTLLLVRV